MCLKQNAVGPGKLTTRTRNINNWPLRNKALSVKSHPDDQYVKLNRRSYASNSLPLS